MEKQLLKIVFSLFLVFISNTSFSQQQDYIVGKLLDAKNQEPIAFASIRIKDRALGIISNIDGSFKIPLKYKEYGDIIEISSMGYQTQEILIQDFSIYELNNVRLQPAILELEEAIVSARKKRRRKLSSRDIVQKAIDRLFENYPTKPYSQIGYYRDYQKDKQAYVNLNEGILEVFDQGFKATDSSTTKVSIYNYQENNDFRRDTLARMPYDYSFKKGAKIIDNGYLSAYGGNEFTILRVHNAIRNYKIDSYSFVHRFDTDLLENHTFSRDEDSFIANQALYKIRFRKNLPRHSAYGALYISKDDYAIYKMEYAVYDDAKKNEAGVEDKNGSKKQLVFETNTSYRKTGDKMYLSYISFYNLFKLWEPPKLKLEYVDFRFDKTVYYKMKDLRMKKRWIVLTFNEILNASHVDDIDKFNLSYKGKKIALKGLLLSDKQVILYPKANTEKQIQLLEEIELVAKRNGLSEEILKIKLSDLKDTKGNYIDEWTNKDYHQFREFFVQQIKPENNSPVNTRFMDMRKPIFDNIPILKPDNFDDYWMNTPLQNIKN
ncbi:carboxypeptidase-like regulatory domain-containing protein [Maribacter sp. 2308TA10-17]|uniref:carboxypeptidase-like regulatory domain-containing protein n=1 Tax=Maribacter sp. 2308TA10-17 TaxID=3386276 RepID=UPI0039BCF9E2